MTIHTPDSGGQDTGVPIRDHLLADYLYQRLPGAYRSADAQMGQTVTEVLKQLPDLDVSSLDPSVQEEYQLQRFYRIFGAMFNAARSDLDSVQFLRDIDVMEPKWFPQIAKLFGWSLNLELPVDLQRTELKNVVNFYKQKGRQSVLDFLLQQLTDFSFSYVYGRDRLLTTPHKDPDLRINPGSHVFDDSEGITLGLKTDENYYTFGQRTADNDSGLAYGVQYVFLYLTQNLLNANVTLLTAKIGRLSEELVPWGVELIIITDSFYGEPDWDIGSQGEDTDHIHAEDWQSDSYAWLHTWEDPATFGLQPPGITVPKGIQVDGYFYYKTFHRMVIQPLLEEHESDPPITIVE